MMSTTSVTKNSSSSSSTLPPITSILPSATFSAPQPSSTPLPLLPEEAVATSSHLQQYSAVRKLTRDLQLQKPRHPKQSQFPPGETGTLTKRIVHTAVYKQKIKQYNEALKHYEQIIDRLLSEQAIELAKIFKNVDAIVNNLQTHSKLENFKTPIHNFPPLSPLRIHFPKIFAISAFSDIHIAPGIFP